MTKEQVNALKVLISAIDMGFKRGAYNLSEAESIGVNCRIANELLINGEDQGKGPGEQRTDEVASVPGK